MLVILLFVQVLQLRAQDTSIFKEVGFIEGEYVDFTIDNLGNYYLVSKNNQLKKLNARGDSMGIFNDVRRFGKLYSINVSNPLKVLLYYKNFATIVVLDRFLNVVNTIDLRKQGIFQVKAVALGYDNNIWIFDEQNNKLKRIGEDGQTIFETVDLRIIFDDAPSPEKIFDQDGFVYLYDQDKGLFVFDIYGSFKTRVSCNGLQSVSIFGKTLIGIENGNIIGYSINAFSEKKLLLPAAFSDYQQAIILPGHSYLLQPNGIRHFTF